METNAQERVYLKARNIKALKASDGHLPDVIEAWLKGMLPKGFNKPAWYAGLAHVSLSKEEYDRALAWRDEFNKTLEEKKKTVATSPAQLADAGLVILMMDGKEVARLKPGRYELKRCQ